MNTVAGLPANVRDALETALRYVQHTSQGKQKLLVNKLEAALASPAPSGGEAFGWYCAKDRRFYRAGEWGNRPCGQCVPLYTTPPPAPAAEQGCPGCEGKPVTGNSPCGVCGATQPEAQEESNG